jgi:hypothetical protein
MPEELDDRAHDKWRPLFAVADAISNELGQQARDAAIYIDKESTGDDEDDAAVMALADVAAFIKKENEGRKNATPPMKPMIAAKSEEIVALLINMAERPWAGWRRGHPLTTHSLARLLKPFGLKPKQHRIGPAPADKIRGYATKEILEAEERYVDDKTDEVVEEAIASDQL